ncbi:hypothetical protein [Spongiactinospora sp. TRM90649]|uniref:hypothetical protein n=1 Tax=Spongiactinospora sp. TRM90649 TaxID=3031114 RepID=UPI0023F925D2|nr:hypothetical protein [Spongiactinospora sp. TRM90649]MDF5756352.1 hypothetical protein [Spongiactinospora sp. TRM90649]
MSPIPLRLDDFETELYPAIPGGATLESLPIYNAEVTASIIAEDIFLCSCCCC